MSKSATTTEPLDLLRNPTPGDVLSEDFLKPLGMSQTALAKAIGVSPRRINEIVLGKRAVTADTDLRLSRYWGLSEGFWLGLQIDHDLMQARRKLGRDPRSHPAPPAGGGAVAITLPASPPRTGPASRHRWGRGASAPVADVQGLQAGGGDHGLEAGLRVGDGGFGDLRVQDHGAVPPGREGHAGRTSGYGREGVGVQTIGGEDQSSAGSQRPGGLPQIVGDGLVPHVAEDRGGEARRRPRHRRRGSGSPLRRQAPPVL